MGFVINLFKELNTVGLVIIYLITGIFAFSFILNLVIRKKYTNIQSDLEDRHRRRSGEFKSDLLNKIIDDYKNTASGNYNEVNTQAIIEKSFNLRLRELAVGERFIKNSISIIITLGLLGTFIGLTLTVGNISDVLKDAKVTDMFENPDSFIGGLISSVGGMAVAFLTSLFGIGCSILLNLLYTVFNAAEARETLMVHIEEYLDNTVALVVSKDKETEYSMMNKILRETFTEFGEKIQRTLQETVDNFGDKLTKVVMNVDLSSKALDNTVEKFDTSLKNFALNMKDFSEFNINLRNNIERMDVNFIKVTESLKNSSQIIVDNYGVIDNFSKDIRIAGEEMTSYNRQVIKDIGTLVSEVQSSVSSIKELGDVLGRDMHTRTEDMQIYQDKFGNLMDKLSNEINTLGQQTANAFAESLAYNGKEISEKVVENIQNALKEVFLMLDTFKENERLLAKTIAMLPDQALTYNEAAATKIDKKLDEIKSFIDR